MGLFDVVPSNFFSVLVSGNREIYVDALMLLHQIFKFELNIRVDDYISSVQSKTATIWKHGNTWRLQILFQVW